MSCWSWRYCPIQAGHEVTTVTHIHLLPPLPSPNLTMVKINIKYYKPQTNVKRKTIKKTLKNFKKKSHANVQIEKSLKLLVSAMQTINALRIQTRCIFENIWTVYYKQNKHISFAKQIKQYDKCDVHPLLLTVATNKWRLTMVKISNTTYN